MKFKTAYSKKSRVQLDTGPVSLTEQHHKQACDINHLLRRYQKTGLLDHVNRYQGRYEDVSTIEDYQTSLNTIAAAHECFDSLPSSIRKKFSNDPQVFLDFVSVDENIPELIEMGLIQSSAAEVVPSADAPGTTEADPAGGVTDPQAEGSA
jgi:phage internal scaffolding protein